jgi:alkylation response protein AidB-like acyl-CoA dehydrogenase
MGQGGEQSGRYQPSGDQLALASSLADALEDLLPIARLHQAAEETAETWSLLEGLGLFGIALDEEAGGSGLGAAEQALIVAALGRQLASPTVLATIGAAHAHWNGGAPPGLDGRRVAAAYETRARTVVIEDPEADLVLLRGPEPKIYSGPADLEPLDDVLWTVRLAGAGGLGNSVAGFDPEEALRLRLLDAAMLSGLAEAGLQMAVAYAGMREQFGRPIGSFQAIKHRCADMAMAARGARDLVTFAAVAFDDRRADAGMLIESAFLMAGIAALDNAAANIQIHGGIGFSDEADPHLVLKRTQVCLAIAGGLEAAADRVAAASPGQA